MKFKSIFFYLLLYLLFPSFSICQSPFKVIIASDPQPFFKKYLFDKKVKVKNGQRIVEYSNIDADENRAAFKTIFEGVMDEINKPNTYRAIIINGDLTNSGNSKQIPFYESEISSKLIANDLYFPGLGNHDVYENSGAVGVYRSRWSFDHMINRINSISSKVYSKQTIHYAFKIDQFVFLQLNVSPFDSYQVSRIAAPPVNIPQSYEFLERVIKKANEDNLQVVINMHAFKDDEYGWTNSNARRFKDLISKSSVVAIFAGHYHGELGEVNYNEHEYQYTNKYNTKVPIFYSGAMYLGSYLEVTLNSGSIDIDPKVIEFDDYGAVIATYSDLYHPVNSIIRFANDINYSMTNKSEFPAYVVQLDVNYSYQGRNHSLSTGVVEVNSSKNFYLPAGASGIKWYISYKDGLKWKTLEEGEGSSYKTFRVSGSVGNPILNKE